MIADITICYKGDISIPHTWYTIEDYNNQLYIATTSSDLTLSASILTIPVGNYTAPGLATALSSFIANQIS